MSSSLITPVDVPVNQSFGGGDYANQANPCNLECDEIIDDAMLHQIQRRLDVDSTNALNNKQLLQHLGHRLQSEEAEFDQFVQTQWNREAVYQPFMQYFTYQKGVTEDMRAVLFDWMYEVGADFKLQTDTVMRACNVVDRYLSLCPPHVEAHQCSSLTEIEHSSNGTTVLSGCGIPPTSSATCAQTNNNVNNVDQPISCTESQFNIGQHNLQLLGVTALYIIGKFDEVRAPKLDDFCSTTDGACTMPEMITMERRILKVIDWKLVAPTVSNWMMTFIRSATIACISSLATADKTIPASTSPVFDRVCANDVVRMVSSDLFKHALNCIHIFTRDARSLQYYPSTIAASILCILHPPGSNLHAPVLAATSYAYSDLRRCIELLQCVWAQIPLICDYRSTNVFESPSCGICTYLPESISVHRTCVEHYEYIEMSHGYQVCHNLLDVSSSDFIHEDDMAQLKQKYAHAPIRRPLVIGCVSS
jgi:hypothetical protein